MKKQRSRLWIKITAVILFGVFVMTAAVCTAAVAVMAVNNVYVDGGAQIRQRVVSGRLFMRQMDMLADYYKSSLRGDSEYFDRYFAEENCNFYFTVENGQGSVLLSNYHSDDCQYRASRECRVTVEEREVYEEGLYFESFEERWAYIVDKMQNYSNVVYEYWDADMDGDGAYECCLSLRYTVLQYQDLVLHGYVKSELTAADGMAEAMHWVNLLISMRYAAAVIAAAAAVCAVALYVFLICCAGHKEGRGDIFLGWQDKIPFDLYLAAAAIPIVYGAAAVLGISREPLGRILGFAALATPAALAVLAVSVTFAARAKAGEWWRNTVIFRVMRLLKRAVLWVGRCGLYIIRSMPLKGRTVLAWSLVIAFEFVMIAVMPCRRSGVMLWWIPEKLILTVMIFDTVASMKRLKRAGEEMAKGNISYTAELKHMHGELRAHGENLNSISDGIQQAVEQRMKSERLKTELITNVSHDIKTPITSIVNYVALLKKEPAGSEQAAEYLDILERQSARLKKLTEDLVEASKASSGSMPVNIERVDLNLLLSQAAAEYGEKLGAGGVEPILLRDEANPEIFADGRLLWRVFDNLLSNICKYALPGTRAYLSTEICGDRVRVVFKNISAYRLEISGEELIKRFVRGDPSRSTEGSGLGLSIAMSLTQLQHGSFAVTTDGDLFRAELEFDLIRE